MAKKKTLQIQAESDDLTVPQDRIEGFLAKAAGLVDTMPEGQFSRLERYLALIAEGGGSGADIEELKQEMQDLFVPKTIGPTQIATFQDGVDGAILGKCVVNIEPVQAGSGDPSPTNVRAISGWTGANVSVAAKNLANITAKETTPCKTTIIRNGNHITARVEAKVSAEYVYNRVVIIPSLNKFIGKKLTVSLGGAESSVTGGYMSCAISIRVPGAGDSDVFVGGIGTRTIQITEAHRGREFDLFMYATGPEAKPAGTYVDYRDIQVEIGDTATEYEPYRGNTYPISFGEAGTVYGGTLDVGTGVLTVDRGMVTATSVTGGYGVVNGYGRFAVALPEDSKGGQYTNSELVKTNYLPAYGYTHGAAQWETPDKDFLYTYLTVNKRFGLVLNGIETTSDANTYLTANPLTVIYELQTPQTYQLTPTQVRTLLGLNNIYADTGDIEIEYRGDIPNLYSLIG